MNRPTLPPTALVLVAAGSSSRMGDAAAVRKPFLGLGGATVLEIAAAAFAAVPEVVEIVLVVHEQDLARTRELANRSPALRRALAIVPGGAERTDSVRAGVAAVSAAVRIVCVHDAARPLIATATIERAIETAAREGAALVAVPLRDTVKVSEDGARAARTLDRSQLWCAQTPQVFEAGLLRELLARAAADGFRPTDDAALHERYKGAVPIVEGEPANLKITTRDDLALAELVLARRAAEARS